MLRWTLTTLSWHAGCWQHPCWQLHQAPVHRRGTSLSKAIPGPCSLALHIEHRGGFGLGVNRIVADKWVVSVPQGRQVAFRTQANGSWDEEMSLLRASEVFEFTRLGVIRYVTLFSNMLRCTKYAHQVQHVMAMNTVVTTPQAQYCGKCMHVWPWDAIELLDHLLRQRNTWGEDGGVECWKAALHPQGMQPLRRILLIAHAWCAAHSAD